MKRTTRTAAALICALTASGALAAASSFAANDVYVFNYNGGGNGTASQYSIGTGGVPSPLTPTTALIGGGPLSGAVSMNGAYLYVTGTVTPKGGIAYGQVSTLGINSDGTLTPLGALQLAQDTNPSGIADDPTNGVVYVADQASDQISILQSTANGTLQPATPTSVTGTGSGTGPLAVAVTPNGQALFETNGGNGTVAAFAIAGDGALTANGSPVPAGKVTGSDPDSIVIAPDGGFAYVADGGDGTISEYSISSGGALSPLPTSPTVKTDSGPDSIAMTPNGQFVYVANLVSNDVDGYTVEADGVLEQISSATQLTAQPMSLAVAPNGGYLYVTNGSGSVSSFQIGAAGSLTPLSGTPPATGADPGGIVITPDAGPAAAFSSSPANAGSPSSFDGSASSAGSAPIGTYSWQFGDGSSGSGATPAHTYATPGQYTVTLTVAGSDSCSNALPFTGVTPFCLADSAASVSHVIPVGGGSPVSQLSATSAGLPTVTITVPKSGANYVQDSTVLSNFSCADGLNAPGLVPGGTGCLGTVADGQAIDTVPGKHTFTVTATSKDGQKATKTVTYTSNGWLNANHVHKGRGPIHGYNCPDHIASTFYLTASSDGHTRIVANAGGEQVASKGVRLPVKKRKLIVLCLSPKGVAYATRSGSPQPFSATMNANNGPYGGSTHLRISFTIR